MKSYINIYSHSNGRIWAVDYLKGFSIFTIALMHLLNTMSALPEIIHTLSAVGGTGVHVFFLCSGIGLYTSYLKHKPSYIDFFKKRFFKIYIPYIIIVLFAFFCPWVYYGDNRVIALLSHLLQFKMFSPMYEGSFGEPFWFVSTIFQLYVVFIPMCWIKDKLNSSKRFICVFCGISVAWWVFCYKLGIGNIRIWGSFFLQYIWEFALGFVLAENFLYGKRFKINNYLLLTLAILGIGLQSIMALFSDALKVFNDIPALVGYLSLALLLSNIPTVNKLCHKLSVFSYEYYLVHTLLFGAAFYFLKPEGFLMQCAVGLIAMIIALGAAFFYNKAMKAVSNSISKYCSNLQKF